MAIPMRRKEKEMSAADAIDLLTSGEYGILSLCGSNNIPYGIPLSYAFFDDAVYFHCAFEGRKIELINANAAASFCVVGSTEILPARFTTKFESVIVSGKAVPVSGEEKRKALVALLEKYSADHMEKGMTYLNNDFEKTCVIKITADDITGKRGKG